METDPEKRLTTEQIKQHPWYQSYKPVCENQGLVVGKNEIPIEPSLLGYLERYGFKKEYATTSLNKNKHNQVTTVYYLLLQRLIKQGKLSSSFKVKLTPNKKRVDDDRNQENCGPYSNEKGKPNRIGTDENQVQINSKAQNQCESPSSRSPEKRKRKLESFEDMINIRTSVPRKSHPKEMEDYNG